MRHFQRRLILITGLFMFTALVAKADECNPSIIGEYYNPKYDGNLGERAYIKISQKRKFISHGPDFKMITSAKLNIPCGSKAQPTSYFVTCDSGVIRLYTEHSLPNDQQCTIGLNPKLTFNYSIFEFDIHRNSYKVNIHTNITTPGFDGVYKFEKYLDNDPTKIPICPDDSCAQW